MKLTREKKIFYSKKLINKVKNTGLPLKPSNSIPQVNFNNTNKCIEVAHEFKMLDPQITSYNPLITSGFEDITFNTSKQLLKLKYKFPNQ